MTMLKIAVVYSLPSSRMLKTKYSVADEDSSVIAKMVVKGLEARGMTTETYPISEDNIESILNIKADCIFNLIEWCGLDIEISQKAFFYFRKLDIPVTGSDEKMFVLTGDKIRVKQELEKMGAPTARSAVFMTGDEAISESTCYPVIVKPSLEHCSMGLSSDAIAQDNTQLRAIVKRQIESFHQPALAEEFIIGRELLVYMIEVDDEVKVLPITEILFTSENPLSFQTYECKWVEGHPDYNSTYTDEAVLTETELKTIESVCVKVFKKMGLRGYARFDIRLKDNVPYILETNANPSVYDATEDLKDINEEVITGIQFPDYLLAIVNSTFYHFKLGQKV